MIHLRIGELVDERGWNIQRFAAEANLAYGTAYGLYKGRVNRIDLTTLDSICEALGIEPGEVFVREPRTKEPVE